MHNNKNSEAQSNSQIRQLKRSQRRELPETVQQKNSKALCQNIVNQRAYKNSQNLACYLANDGEIDPFLLIEHARFLGKNVYLPVISPIKDSLYFAPYTTSGQLRLNRFKIAEPVCHPSKWITASQLDLLLLPLVAFDSQGNRMGMGGGFYDRTLAYLQHRRYWRKPVLMGLAHETQKVDQLNANSWDIPLNHIITEKYFYNADF